MKRLRRRTILRCVFTLALGLVTTLLSAWTSVIMDLQGGFTALMSQRGQRIWDGRVVNTSDLSGGTWSERIWISWRDGQWDGDPANIRSSPSWFDAANHAETTWPQIQNLDLLVTTAGFPMRAWGGLRTSALDGHTPGVKYGGLIYSFAWPASAAGRMLPCIPIWRGLIFDVAVYAALWWCILFTPAPLRRALRRRHGLCPRCAYDLRANFPQGCPECGWGKV